MNLVRVERPRDAVARVNPDFIGKKRKGLVALAATLSSNGGMPLRLRVSVAKRQDSRKSESEEENAQRKEYFHKSVFNEEQENKSSTNSSARNTAILAVASTRP